jgi:chromosome segregation ATPase
VADLSAGPSAGTLLVGVLTAALTGGGGLLLGLLRHRPELVALDDQAKGSLMGGQAALIASASTSAAAAADRAERAEVRLAEQYRESARQADQMGREHDRLSSEVAKLRSEGRITRAQLARAEERIEELERQLAEARDTVTLLSRISARVDEGAATGLRVETEQGVVRSDLGEAQVRADAVDGDPGEAADAASRTPGEGQ